MVKELNDLTKMHDAIRMLRRGRKAACRIYRDTVEELSKREYLLRDQRDQLIVELLARRRMTAAHVARLLGLSRARISQLSEQGERRRARRASDAPVPIPDPEMPWWDEPPKPRG